MSSTQTRMWNKLRLAEHTNAAVEQVETRQLSFWELEAHAEHIHALAQLPLTELKHLQAHMLLHKIRSNEQVPESFRDHTTMFVISGSLEIFARTRRGHLCLHVSGCWQLLLFF